MELVDDLPKFDEGLLFKIKLRYYRFICDSVEEYNMVCFSEVECDQVFNTG